jgi:hypothetical protein
MKKEGEKEVWSGAPMSSEIQTIQIRHAQDQEREGVGLRIM